MLITNAVISKLADSLFKIIKLEHDHRYRLNQCTFLGDDDSIRLYRLIENNRVVFSLEIEEESICEFRREDPITGPAYFDTLIRENIMRYVEYAVELEVSSIMETIQEFNFTEVKLNSLFSISIVKANKDNGGVNFIDIYKEGCVIYSAPHVRSRYSKLSKCLTDLLIKDVFNGSVSVTIP